ncbi:MAG: protease, partial [Proteobacteria bacterium]|nr:protease [Pseudomonadota bacterium]
MALSSVGLSTHIYNNHIKSVLLLLCYPVLLFMMVWMFFTFAGPKINPSAAGSSPADFLQYGFSTTLSYLHYLILFTLGWFTLAYFFHGRMIRAATGSVPVTRKDYPKIYNMLENLCIARGLPMPKFEMIDSPAMNAFASGISEKTYTITLTRGIVEALQDDELEAVIAHELTHIINRDVRLLIISVIFVGMIAFFAEMVFRMLVHGRHTTSMRYGSGRSNNRNNGGGAVMLIGLAILVIGYIFAILTRFALSRKREFLADAGAVELTKSPESMMRALMRISGHDRIKDMPDDIQQMCIENSHHFMGMFATHPPIDKRIAAISTMTGAPVMVAKAAIRLRIGGGVATKHITLGEFYMYICFISTVIQLI